MIFVYDNRKMLKLEGGADINASLLKDTLWIDLLSPTKEEEIEVERCLNLDVPTRSEMQEIELSNRLYKENDIIFMTAMLIAESDSSHPCFDPVTFVLTPQKLITIRYIEPQSFKLLTNRLPKINLSHWDALSLFIELLDATIARLADVLELVGRRLNDASTSIFRPQSSTKLDYRQFMQELGINGDLHTQTRESLISFSRLITFFMQATTIPLEEEAKVHLETLKKDIVSLSDHADFLSTKVNFLLDATLGLVNIEQNNIIKIFSVVTVIFLPPTLISSIYGMNFEFIPELSWRGGYFIALGLMLLFSWLPYKYFKYRKWL